jgi:bifunctional UDP-N-acetylglucosamine pyrophosphorylase/glucosamine-1-phosphate N-acetyltransferase
MNKTVIVILAGGQGTRMKSALPKVMHEVCGRPMLAHLIDAATETTGTRPLVVYSPASAVITEAFRGQADFALQSEPRGTADALRAALGAMPDDAGEIIVTNGDMPLLRPATFASLIEKHRRTQATITMTAIILDNPTGYGRVMSDERGAVQKIVEEKDAAPEERLVKSVNAGLYAFDAAWTRTGINKIEPSPVSGEYYITDLIELAKNDGRLVHAMHVPDPDEFHGINTPEQLAYAEELMRRR